MSSEVPKPSEPPPDDGLERRQAEVRRGLIRANTAAAVILLIVIGLALAAVWQSWRANAKAREAEHANRRLQEQLYDWHLSQARTARVGSAEDRQALIVKSLTAAAALRPSLELRNEAIASLTLLNVRQSFGQELPSRANTVAFDHKLERVAVGTEFGRIEVRRLLDNTLEQTLEGPPAPVMHVQFSADGRFLAAAHGGGLRQIWDIAGAKALATVEAQPGDFFDTVGFAPDNSCAVISQRQPSGSAIHFFKLPSGEEEAVMTFPFQVRHFTLQPGGSLVAFATNRTIWLWDRATRLEAGNLEHTNLVTRLAWHPDGKRLLAATRNGDLWYWDTRARSPRAQLWRGHTSEISDLLFNHRGNLAVSGSADGSTRFWEVTTGRLLLVSRQGVPAGFSPDDLRLAFRRQARGVGIWNVMESAVYYSVALPVPPARSVTALDLDPSGRYGVACGARGLFTFALERAAVARVWLPDVPAYAVAFDTEGSNLFTAGPIGLQRWPLESGEDRTLPAVGEPEPLGEIDGSLLGEISVTRGAHEWLATSGLAGSVIVDLAKLTSPTISRSLPHASALAVSVDGVWLARSGLKLPVLVRRREGDDTERSLGGVGGELRFSPDGRWLVVGNEAAFSAWQVGQWDAPAWKVPSQTPGLPTGQCAFSGDGRVLAVHSSFGTVQLLEPNTGAEIATLTSPNPQRLLTLSFCRNNRWLAALVESGEVQVWDLNGMRTGLAALGLDWRDTAPTVFPAAASTANPRAAGLAASSLAAGWLPLAGALLALGFGAYTLRYQRRLVRRYDELDLLATRRDRQLQQAQAELMHSHKMKALGTLAAGIAHDFNNLLSVIRLANDFLRRGVKSDADLLEETETIEHAVDQGKTVVQSMLGYSRSKSDQPAPLNVCELVEDTLGLLSQQFLSGTRLTVELDRSSPPVRLARGNLEQILLNLIVNASEAMQGGGNLAITVRTLDGQPNFRFVLAPRTAPGYVELAVADTGPGIAPEILPRIFEPFFTTKTLGAQRGTGLGLSMIYTSAQQEELGIALESEVSKGTTFRILIPVEALKS